MASPTSPSCMMFVPCGNLGVKEQPPILALRATLYRAHAVARALEGQRAPQTQSTSLAGAWGRPVAHVSCFIAGIRRLRCPSACDEGTDASC